jgi:putative molybdopterin biosynthesis protein
MATIGAGRLERLRTTLGLSQRALGDAAGISRQAVGAIESGRMQPSVGIALAVARALGTAVEELFGAEAAERPAERVAVASIGGRSVSYNLEGDHLAIEPAQSAARAVFVGGCDLAIGVLARLASDRSGLRVLWLPMTNRTALSALAHDRLHAAVIHTGTGGSKQRTGARFACYELAATAEGWLVAAGNPLRFRGARDLTRTRVRLVNRPAGAGARALLDGELLRAGVAPATVAGYDRMLPGQLDVGRAIAQGFADVAVGTASVARACGLDFIALRDERLSFVVPRARGRDPESRALLETLASPAYRRELEALAAYDVANNGTEVA